MRLHSNTHPRIPPALLPFLALVAAGCAAFANDGQQTPSLPPASVSVDTCSPGYRADVLTDGRWIEKGKERRHGFGDPARLGNGGNTWVSAEAEADHWIRLDWPQPVAFDTVEIWWSLAEWYPRAFRVERLKHGQWVALVPSAGDRASSEFRLQAVGRRHRVNAELQTLEEGWLATTDRKSIIPLPPTRAQSIRLFQPATGSARRKLMAAQEVTVSERGLESRNLLGAKRLSPAAFARLTPVPLARNLARLETHGISTAVPLVWSSDRKTNAMPQLADADLKTRAAALPPKAAVGVQWSAPHSIAGAALVFAGQLPEAGSLGLEVHDGLRWVPVTWGLNCQTLPQQQRIEWSFVPVVTRAFRVKNQTRDRVIQLAEVEVNRYLPTSANDWPEHLTAKDGLKRHILDAAGEPAFESLALRGHSMRSARALLGLKDTPDEIGATWDGTLIGRDKISFRFGTEQYRLAEFPDLVQRRLIDGWRPGVEITGRIGDLEVEETAFVTQPQGSPEQEALYIQVAVRNRSRRARTVPVEAEILSERPDVAQFKGGQLVRGEIIALSSHTPARAGDANNALCVDLPLRPGETRRVTFVQPQDAVGPGTDRATFQAMSFAEALASFRRYWDATLATATVIEVPEPRINLMAKAILAQCFITGDGDIMYYGARPSVYERSLFGIEESYPMLGLALFGYAHDAQRYLDGTYLTREFLKKAESYREEEDRHQQYRNGLQPHYAVSAHRLTRDAAWIGKHLPLLRECAEWTIAQRRKTMVLEKEDRPLHWGLLPKWAYGGDIANVECYALFGNLCCWRGLMDTAWLLDSLGDAETARRYVEEARDYRACIKRAIDGSYLADHQPPFFPLRLYTTQPDEGKMTDFYQLFAGCILDVEALVPGSKHLRWLTDYLEADNRTFCFLPRYRRELGPGGLDAIYGKGYFLTMLHEDAIREFLLAFYAYQAFNLEHDVFTSRESNVLYAGDLHAQSTYRPAEITDPLTCASAVALHLLRHMLVTEEVAEAGTYSGNLRLLAGIPRAWLEDGKTIRLREVPTHFGPVSLEVRSAVAKGRIEAQLTPPKRNPAGSIKLRFRHPTNRPLVSVRVNGQKWTDYDASAECITLPGDTGPCRIEARY